MQPSIGLERFRGYFGGNEFPFPGEEIGFSNDWGQQPEEDEQYRPEERGYCSRHEPGQASLGHDGSIAVIRATDMTMIMGDTEPVESS